MKNWDNKDRMMDGFRVCRAIRRSSSVILLGLFCLLFAATASAQSSNRWLFIFNTSASMRDRSNGVQAVTQDLLSTAMHGNVRPGDTIGIWTYNATLRADEAPLQIWYPNTAPAIAYNTVEFMRRHSYEKTAAFGDVLTNILRVVKISDVITVILISDGTDPISGTPFDANIAAFYKTNSQKQKKAHMPIVTLFRGEGGKLMTNTLTLGPWPIDIPAVPPPRVVAQVAPKPAPVAPAKPVPSLIVIGKKAETTFNVPADLPDHSGDLPDRPESAPPQTEPTPAVAKPETQAPAPAPAQVSTPTVEEKPNPVAATPVASAPTPAPAAAVEPEKPLQTAQAPIATTPESTEPATKAVAPAASPIVVEAATAPEKNLFTVRNIAIVSITFTLLVCVLLFLTARNARNASRSSLITRSLDRER